MRPRAGPLGASARRLVERAGVWGAVLLALLTGAAWADEYHLMGFPTGSRAAGMGGAFTALATDSSALFYNPAGLVLSAGTELSLSTSVYSVVSDSIEGSRSQQPPVFSAYPSTFAVIKTPCWQPRDDPSPRHRYGFTVLVTDHTQLSRQDVDGQGRLALLSSTDETTYYGAGYSYRPAKWLSLGASGFLVQRSYDALESRLAPAGARDFSLYRRELAGSHFALRFFGGALFMPHESVSAGLSVRSQSLGVRGSLTSVEFEKSGGALLAERTAERGLFVDRTPWAVVGGLVVRPRGWLTLSADVVYHAALGTYRVLQTEDFAEEATKVAVVNLALGAELSPVDWLPVRLGFYTDRSSRGGPPAETLGQAAVDLNVVTGSVGYERHHATIVLGGAFAWGRKGALGREEVRWWVAASYRL